MNMNCRAFSNIDAGKRPHLAVVFALAAFFSTMAAGAPTGETRTELDARFRPDRSEYPILMDSHGRVGIWEGERENVFVFHDRTEIRQGGLRIIASRAVVRVEKGAGRAAEVRVYAEGAGMPGMEADVAVIMALENERTEASAMHLVLRTLQGVAWECPHHRIKNIDTVQLVRHARAVRDAFGADDSYTLRLLPDPDLEPLEAPEQPPDVLRADSVRIFTREEDDRLVVVYAGNVHGSYADISLSADAAVMWIDTKNDSYEVYARGNVILNRAEDGRDLFGREGLETLRVDRIYINPAAERGLALDPELRMKDERRDEIYVVRGRKAYILDSENMLIHDGGATNCPHGIPHYEFRARRIQFVQQPDRLFASAWNIRLVAGERQRALFWLPFLGMTLYEQTYLLRSISLGRTSGLGTTLKTRWGPSDLGIASGWMDDWTVSADYYSRRGTGIGTDIEYSFGKKGQVQQKGYAGAYYIHDRADLDAFGRAVPRSYRGRVQLQHRVEWSSRWRTDLEYSYLSDYAFLREYERSRFVSEKAPENQIFTSYRSNHLWGGLQVKTRLNDFMTQREALPGLELHLLGVGLGPFSYNALFDGGLYEYKLSREESFREGLDRTDPPEIVRLHTDHRLSLPFSAGFLKLSPFLRVLGTYASKGADQNGEFRDALSRFGGGGGFGASADFSRVYNVGNENMKLNRLRHVVTPFLEAEKLVVDRNSRDFIQMRALDPWPRYGRGPRERDDWIDAFDDREILKVGVRQRMQTRRGGRSADWMHLNVAAVFRNDDSVGVVLDDDNYIEADFKWELTPKLTLTAQDNRISMDGTFNVINAGVNWTPVPRLGASAGYNHIRNRTSSIAGGLDVELSDRYSLSLFERYELDRDGTGRSRNMRTEVVLSRWFHKWLMEMEFYYDGRGGGDSGVFVRFSPSFLRPFGRGEGVPVL